MTNNSDISIKSPFPDMNRPYPPYLENPPAQIKIDNKSQLFIDDFLISETNMKRKWFSPEPYAENPVLKPETEAEMNDGLCPLACPFNDGVWIDPDDGLYKMWYHAGWFDGTALAISKDGLHWERPEFDVVPGTNLVLPSSKTAMRDGALVWLDKNTKNPAEKWKMFLFEREIDSDHKINCEHGSVLSSGDGIHWEFHSHTGHCGDNSSFYYDQFRKKWIYSVRSFGDGIGRMRSYFETENFFDCHWKNDAPIKWLACDKVDKPDPAINFAPQLYDFNAAPYESLMLGIFAIMRGPENDVCEKHGIPKTNDLEIAFSRDGINWFRPETEAPFLRASRKDGAWDKGYLHAAGGIWVDDGEKLRFYYAGWSGISPKLKGSAKGNHFASNAMYAGGSTGFASLRRDGFASIKSDGQSGILVTRPLLIAGSELYVNYRCPEGELRVELLDADGKAIPGYSYEDALPLKGDSTEAKVRWKSTDKLPLTNGTLRLKFHVSQGEIFSFRTKKKN